MQCPRTQAVSRGSRTEQNVVTVEITDGTHRGWGECTPYARYDETVEGVIAEIEALPMAGLDRVTLSALMPAGAASMRTSSVLQASTHSGGMVPTT